MHFEIIRILDNASTSIDELWRNVSTSLRPIKPMHDFGKDFVIHSFSSVVNREPKHVTFLSHGRQSEVNILQCRTLVPLRFSK